MEDPKITFVFIAFNERHDMLVSVGSLLCQKNPNWNCIVIQGEPNDEYNRLFNPGPMSTFHKFADPRIKFIMQPENTGSYGDRDRKYSLDLIPEGYIIQSSIQDYYRPETVDEILKAHDQGNPDIIIWDSYNHLFSCTYPLIAEPTRRKIDWGNYAVKADVARKVGINNAGSVYTDGLFAEELIAAGATFYKIPKVLTIHN